MTHPTDKMPPHPYAFLHPSGYQSGAHNMRSGDRIVYDIDGRHGRADEFLHDGDAFVTFDDGTYATVKWNNLSLEK